MTKNNRSNKKIITALEGAFDGEVKRHAMLENKDRVLVGISGGVDSLVLLKNIARWKKYFLEDIQISAVYINLLNLPYKADIKYLENFCKKNNVHFLYKEMKVEKDKTKIRTNPCFICSRVRRKILFDMTKELNFNKLALGHHLNDAVETFLMNIMYHGTISSLPAKLKMFDGRIFLIRPMISIEKNKIIEYAKIKGIEVRVKTCEYAELTKRSEVNEVIEVMKKFVHNPYNKIFRAMRNIFSDYLP